jgi:hypothetical protein
VREEAAAVHSERPPARQYAGALPELALSSHWHSAASSPPGHRLHR